MPFPPQVPKMFTRMNVEALKRGQMGCYALFKAGEWIYVGKGDIRQRLLSHLNGDDPAIIRSGPTHWLEVVTNDYHRVHRGLITELTPSCNSEVDKPIAQALPSEMPARRSRLTREARTTTQPRQPGRAC